ncbi:MAG TPA: hypothetical protein VIH10_17120 [Kribbella sp.]|jgi:hypothetical protein
MTAQHHEVQPEVQPGVQPEIPVTTGNLADPLGPITLPKRTKVGARAMALAGTVGLSAFAIAAVADGSITWPTISAH